MKYFLFFTTPLLVPTQKDTFLGDTLWGSLWLTHMEILKGKVPVLLRLLHLGGSLSFYSSSLVVCALRLALSLRRKPTCDSVVSHR